MKVAPYGFKIGILSLQEESREMPANSTKSIDWNKLFFFFLDVMGGIKVPSFIKRLKLKYNRIERRKGKERDKATRLEIK